MWKKVRIIWRFIHLYGNLMAYPLLTLNYTEIFYSRGFSSDKRQLLENEKAPSPGMLSIAPVPGMPRWNLLVLKCMGSSDHDHALSDSTWDIPVSMTAAHE